MKVYTLAEEIHYEGSDVLGVFRTEEGAKAALLRLVEEDRGIETRFFAQNYVLSSDGLSAEGRGVSLNIESYEVEE